MIRSVVGKAACGRESGAPAAPWFHHVIAGRSWMRSPDLPKSLSLFSLLNWGKDADFSWDVLFGSPPPLPVSLCLHLVWRRSAYHGSSHLPVPIPFALLFLYFHSTYHLLTYCRIYIFNVLCLFLINSSPHRNVTSLRVGIYIYFASTPP